MRFTRWDQVLSTKETNEVIKDLALNYCSRINATHTREYLASCIASDCFLALCDFEPSYEELSVSDAINVRQVCALYSKREDLDVGIDKRRAAVGKFIEAEKLCQETNDILEKVRRGEFSFLQGVEPVIFTARRKIATILGDAPSIDTLKLRFGPGATTQIPKRIASTKRKLSMGFACSEDLLPIVRSVIEEIPHLIPGEEEISKVSVEIHTGNLAFVPKSCKTYRSVMVEPWLNSFVQLGIDGHMRKRLARHGLDLSDQSLNQRLAREGSLTGELATLDLSSASDTIALELVYDLLPWDWFNLLSLARTSRCTCDGFTFSLEKFSSMGNGYTFPLESLIFYAIALAVVPEDQHDRVNVYGDDIIIPSTSYEELVRVLQCLGFVPNKAKSYAKGSFRESCGADYLRGINIRPFYQKKALGCFDLFRLHNFAVRQGDDETAALVLQLIDPLLVKWGPEGYGDGHLISRSRPMSPYKRHLGWSGYTFETYTFKPKKDFATLPGDRILPFYSVYQRYPYAPSKEALPDATINLLRHSVRWAKSLLEIPALTYDARGRLGSSLPGRGTCRLIKIYVLSA